MIYEKNYPSFYHNNFKRAAFSIKNFNLILQAVTL